MTVAELLERLRDVAPSTVVRVAVDGGPHLPALRAIHACYWVGDPVVAFVIHAETDRAAEGKAGR